MVASCSSGCDAVSLRDRSGLGRLVVMVMVYQSSGGNCVSKLGTFPLRSPKLSTHACGTRYHEQQWSGYGEESKQELCCRGG